MPSSESTFGQNGRPRNKHELNSLIFRGFKDSGVKVTETDPSWKAKLGQVREKTVFELPEWNWPLCVSKCYIKTISLFLPDYGGLLAE